MTAAMTKRETIAAMMMQGILANPVRCSGHLSEAVKLVPDAVVLADVLLVELEK